MCSTSSPAIICFLFCFLLFSFYFLYFICKLESSSFPALFIKVSSVSLHVFSFYKPCGFVYLSFALSGIGNPLSFTFFILIYLLLLRIIHISCLIHPLNFTFCWIPFRSSLHFPIYLFSCNFCSSLIRYEIFVSLTTL